MFNITKIFIVSQKWGMDYVILHTDLPPAVALVQEPNSLMFYAAKNTGKEYCEKHFPGVEIKVIES